ncbi:hypothetical protein AB6G20_02705 [Providencia hangzhouensis]|uniref:hypothetical protein n=1 Tax=Providencia hangzhouensis TaxID=3031799 RepID=UPI0034DCE96D
MKKYIAVSLFLIATASTASFVINKNHRNVQICHSEILWIKDNNTQEIGLALKSKINLQISTKIMVA